ncbi:MAG: Competence protein A [bacterium ADurb.Bin157]|nr:MAG: Competence protein A [bacterium ADurb.Bin157]
MSEAETTEKKELFVAVDIGSYSLKFAFVQQNDEGRFVLRTLAQLVIPKYETKIDPDQRELMSKEDVKQYCLKELRQMLTTKLTELLYDNEIQTKQAITFASNREITIRCLEVPVQTDKNKYPEIIKIEANKQMPFSMTNAIFGHTILDSINHDGEEWKQVMVAALQKDTIEYINANLKGGALICDGILTLPQSLELALATQMQPYSEEGKKVAIIHCGDSATAVMIYKNNKLQFFRDVNMGGATITEAIFEGGEVDGEKVKPATYEEATALKHRIGIIPPDDAENLKGIEKFAAEKIFETVEKIFQHIQLSVSFYISQANETSVDLIILSGGSAGMINFKDFIEESLEIPVELAKPFNNLQIGEIKYSKSQKETDAPGLAPVLGTALYSSERTEIINFLDILNPGRKDKKQTVSIGSISSKFGKKFSFSGASLPNFSLEFNEFNARIIVSVIATILAVILLIPVININKQVTKVKADFKKLTAQKTQIERENGNITELLNQQNNLKKFSAFAEDLQKLRINNSQVIAEIASITPKQIFLTSFEFNLGKSAQTFILSGHADNSDSVFDYLAILSKTKIFLNPMLRSTQETLIDESRYFITFSLGGTINVGELTAGKGQSTDSKSSNADNFDEYEDFEEME